MSEKKKLAPREAKTFNQICELPRDNVSYGDFTFMLDGPSKVYISEQPMGGNVKQHIVLPRHVFEKFVRWYETGSMMKGKP